MDHLIAAHGGTLNNLVADESRSEQLKADSGEFVSVTLSRRQLCDLELLLNGGYSPLQGFMGRAAWESVVTGLQLPDGTLWSIPVTLDIPDRLADQVEPGQTVALRDGEGFMLAVMHVEDKWRPDRRLEALEVYATDSTEHPGVFRGVRRVDFQGLEPPVGPPLVLDMHDRQHETLAVPQGDGLPRFDLVGQPVRNVQCHRNGPQRAIRKLQAGHHGLPRCASHEALQRRIAAIEQQFEVAQLAPAQRDRNELTRVRLELLAARFIRHQIVKRAAVCRYQMVHILNPSAQEMPLQQ